MKVLDLFSGIGGFSLAARQAGFETVGFCEIDPFCRKVLAKHWPNVPIWPDVRTMEFEGDVDIITGGIPCQPFSIAGKKRGRNDSRHLWPEMYRLIAELKPRFVLIENVAGFVELELDNVLDDLELQGYETQSFIIPACAAGAPHRRERLWIIAHANGVRRTHGRCDRQERYVQTDIDRDVSALQSIWSQFQPIAWAAYETDEWLQRNASHGRGDNGIPDRLDRVKALGTAIVPQVAIVFFLLIRELDKYGF
jgi:DNA (cytosine-5)-methyltransferase 1